jgi:hypothetical protein
VTVPADRPPSPGWFVRLDGVQGYAFVRVEDVMAVYDLPAAKDQPIASVLLRDGSSVLVALVAEEVMGAFIAGYESLAR